MARINFRNKKLYSSRTDRPGWFDNQHGGTRQIGLTEFESFKSSYTPQSNAKILLKNQYFISTRYHSGYGNSVSYSSFGRSNIDSFPITNKYSESIGVYMNVYLKGSTGYSTYGFFSPNAYTIHNSRDVVIDVSANARIYELSSSKNTPCTYGFLIKKVDYDRF